jgi:hypothetical protein
MKEKPRGTGSLRSEGCPRGNGNKGSVSFFIRREI